MRSDSEKLAELRAVIMRRNASELAARQYRSAMTPEVVLWLLDHIEAQARDLAFWGSIPTGSRLTPRVEALNPSDPK